MTDLGPRRHVGKHGTDVAAFDLVQNAVSAKIRRLWSGWSLADREDLHQLVMVQYFQKFGRGRLEEDATGKPIVPHGWLNTAVRTTGIDFDRKRRARPADPADFQGDEAHALEWLLQQRDQPRGLSSNVAVDVDIRRQLSPALQAFGEKHPLDLKMIVWRYVEGREIDASAEILGKSPAAAKFAVRRALTKLRQVVLPVD